MDTFGIRLQWRGGEGGGGGGGGGVAIWPPMPMVPALELNRATCNSAEVIFGILLYLFAICFSLLKLVLSLTKRHIKKYG